MTAYKVYISDLQVDAIIGILESEREKRQRVVADVIIEYLLEDNHYVNYANVASKIENLLIKKQYGLLEDALKDMMIRIKEDYPAITSIRMKLSKPDIVENCVVAVERYRKY